MLCGDFAGYSARERLFSHLSAKRQTTVNYSTSAALQLDFRVAGVDGHTSAAWVGEPPVREIWGLVALDPSHPILILSRNAALVSTIKSAFDGFLVLIVPRRRSSSLPGIMSR